MIMMNIVILKYGLYYNDGTFKADCLQQYLYINFQKGEILKRNGDELMKLKIGEKTYNYEWKTTS